MKRRNFIRNLGAAGLVFGTVPLFSCSPTGNPLRIPVLGGTDFLDPAVVKAGLQKGHRLTLFNGESPIPGCSPTFP